MNRPTQILWHLMNEYHLNQTCKIIPYMFKHSFVNFGDYNYVLHKTEHEYYQETHRDPVDAEFEMPGNVQIHHNYQVIKRFKRYHNVKHHNLYLLLVNSMIGYFTVHSLTLKDVQKLKPCLREYSETHKIDYTSDNLKHLSINRNLPPYAYEDTFNLSGDKYWYGDKGKPERSPNYDCN